MKRRGQRWVALVSSVLLTVLLSGCPGGGEGDERPFAGTWQGTTSQGNNVSFVVANDHTITTVTAGAHITGDACIAHDDALTEHLTGERPPIVGNQFSVVVNRPVLAIFPPPVGIVRLIMTGTFANESTASGELQFAAILAPSPCTGTATVTFQARKQ